MLRRLYFALWPDAPTREAVARSRASLFPLSGRPVAVADLHVTVAFLGGVAESRLPALRGLAVAFQDAHTLRLDRLDWWRRPRAIVAGSSAAPEGLRRCVDELWARLDRLGFAREPRPWQPHVTLVRDAQPLRATSRWSAVDWPATGFSLVETAPAGDGPRYRIVAAPNPGVASVVGAPQEKATE